MIRVLVAFASLFLLAACASGIDHYPSAPAAEEVATVPPPPPQPEELNSPPAPRVKVEVKEEGNEIVMISRRGEEELDRKSIRKVQGLRYDNGRECAFDSPAHEVDYVIVAFVISPHGRMSEDYDPVLYSVYGASTYDGKFKAMPKRSASCYFLAH